MQLGILGLPKVGKTTLFNTLTASHESTDKFATSEKTHVAVAKVPDDRLARLRELFNPRRYTPATVEYVDIPGVQKGEGAESLDLAGTSTRHGRRERLAMRGREHHHMVAEGGLGGRQGADDVGEPAGLGERHYFRREVRDPQRHRQTPLKAVESLEPRVES